MNELEQVANALAQQNYRHAAQLLKQLQKQSPHNPWVLFYIGRWYELNQKLEEAEKIYRKVLRDATNPKIVSQARQGIERIETIERNRRQDAIAQAQANPENIEPGILILEAIDPEQKATAAQTLARMLKIDAYTARMQLQSRGWRLYRTGKIGELEVYGQEMLKANIPVFWVKLSDLEKIHVFRVHSIKSLFPQLTIVCQNELDQLGSLTLSWSEVQQRVEGFLPLFMEAFDYDPRRPKLERFRHKDMTQDYAQICDLHLPHRRSILRFCDQTYDFQAGVDLNSTAAQETSFPSSQNTARLKWNQLLKTFNDNLINIPIWNDFTPFAETALDYTVLLGRFKSYIDLERKKESPWDASFHLYSCLVFFKSK